MRKLRNWFYYLLILSGFPLMFGLAYFIVADSYMFWKIGVPKKAEIIALNHEGKYNFNNYEVEIEDARINVEFAYKVPVGKRLNVLTLPGPPMKVTLGTKKTSLYEIFSYKFGGHFMAILIILVFGAGIIFAPSMLIEIIKKRRSFIEQ